MGPVILEGFTLLMDYSRRLMLLLSYFRGFMDYSTGFMVFLHRDTCE